MKEPQHKTPAPDTAHTEKSPGSKPETSAADPKQGFDGILYPAFTLTLFIGKINFCGIAITPIFRFSFQRQRIR